MTLGPDVQALPVAAAATPRQIGLLATLRCDLKANKRNPKGLFVVVLYRFAHACTGVPAALRPLTYLYIAFYKIITEYIVGTEIHWRATIGPGLAIFHGYSLVVHSSSRLGRNVVLRHNVTIGAKSADTNAAPIIGDNVDFGTGAIIIGPIRVGDRAVIGAGAVVTKDVAAGAVVVGNPARPIYTIDAAGTAL